VLGDALVRMGGSVEAFDLAAELDDADAEQWAGSRAALRALVFDAGAAFGEGGQAGLRAALDQAWMAIRAVAAGALIPGHGGGKIVLLTPRANAGMYAAAARSGLENLARTLSVEWARYGITTSAVAPGATSTDEEVAVLIAYLLSRAGDYFSGCRFELGAALIRAS
jgi:NAD(P)-dependent dehydrogenase (short-subunit alcohol dehydrogenase family)